MSAVPAMRSLLAFALSALDAEGVDPWSVEVVNEGRQLRIAVSGGDTEAAHRLAAALGVEDPHTRQQESTNGAGIIYTVGSRAPRESWHKPDAPVYFGASVPFDGRLVEVTVVVFDVEDQR